MLRPDMCFGRARLREGEVLVRLACSVTRREKLLDRDESMARRARRTSAFPALAQAGESARADPRVFPGVFRRVYQGLPPG